MRSMIIALPAIGFLLTAGSIRSADNKSIQGKVTGADGKAFARAEIVAEQALVKAQPAIVKTDSNGQYVFRGLPVGLYTVTAYVEGVPMSQAKIRISSAGWTKLDFDLRLNDRRGGGADRMQTDLSMSTPSPGR
jgi:hypothetical protein